jgi:hypothetical protein
MSRGYYRTLLTLATVAAGVLACLSPVTRADLIFLKDGFVIEGKTKQETKVEIDPINREGFLLPTGAVYIDDGPRRFYFSQTMVRIVEEKESPGDDQLIHRRPGGIVSPRRMVPIDGVLDEPGWNKDWERKLTIRSGGQTAALGQHISILTPHWFRADATATFSWSAAYLTRELSLNDLVSLLSNHKDFEETPQQSEEERGLRRLRFSQFCAQAGWYGEAERELKRMLADFPSQKEKAERALQVIANIRAREDLERMKRLHRASQHALVQKLLADFDEERSPEDVLAAVKAMRRDYEKITQQGKEAADRLAAVAKEAAGEDRELFQRAVQAILAEMDPSNLDRLDPFLSQARQAERQIAKGMKPFLEPNDLLALAVSGWLLGGASAEANTQTAVRLWRGREMVQTYLTTPGRAGWGQVLGSYLSEEKQPISIDWMAQMLTTMPPPEAAESPRPVPVELQAPGGAAYLVQVPPEYRHTRAYPVLVVLHDSTEKPVTALKRWSAAAGEYGFIVVAPQWQQGLSQEYTYSPAEHDAVVASLNDLRRRFNVDSDQVFLFGLGSGADMAFDVGLSHPHLFAGVVPMGGHPNYFTMRYVMNTQYLPFLIYTGDRSGDSAKKTQEVASKWMQVGFPTVWVHYKGRGVEWFGGEVPTILEWMRDKRRAFPRHQLGIPGSAGFGKEFATMRACDDRFYWFGLRQISPRCLNTVGGWNNAATPATVAGRVDPVSNTVHLNTRGFGAGTIYVERDTEGNTLIDFTKPVTVYANLRARFANRLVKPDLEVLLEELYERGDRQRLVLGKFELDL